MSRPFLLAAACLLPLAALAQTAAPDVPASSASSPVPSAQAVAAERSRIARQRGEIEATYEAARRGCYQKFAVTDCVNAARATRREELADLRRQEISLNDAERKGRAAEKHKDLESRQSEKTRQDKEQARAKSVHEQQQREARSAEKAVKSEKSAAQAQERADHSARPRKPVTVPDIEENVRRHDERTRDAAEHRAKVEKRAAENRKQVQPLPVPP